MASTYTPIATTTLGSAAAQVTFSSISGSYTDLVLIANPIYTATTATLLTINSDTGSNYSGTWLYGTGSAAGSYRVSNSTLTINYFNNASTDTPNNIIQFMNYANTSTYKTILSRNNNAAQGVDALVGLWRNTAAITTIKLSPNSGNFNTGSTFTLYGIKAA